MHQVAVWRTIARHDGLRRLLIAGCGRSGTTWLAEMVNHDNSYRLIFEPFRHDIGPPVAQELGYWRYLRPDYRDEPLRHRVSDVLAGRVANPWADQFGDVSKPHTLVKEIRGHFLLGWLRESFPSLPMVLILRHPCAVAASEIRMGWTGWDEPIDAIRRQPDLIADHLAPFADLFDRPMTTFERRIVLWCLRTIVPRRQWAGRLDLHVLFYERLIVEPLVELTPLFTYLGRPLEQPSVLAAWSRPSAMRVAHVGLPINDDQLAGWRKTMEASDIDRAMRVLERFGLDDMYGDDPLPRDGATFQQG